MNKHVAKGALAAILVLIVGADTAAVRARLIASARTVAGTAILDFFGVTAIRNGCF